MNQSARGPTVQCPTGHLHAFANAGAILVEDIGNGVCAIGCVFNHDAELLLVERIIAQREGLHEAAFDTHDMVFGAIGENFGFGQQVFLLLAPFFHHVGEFERCGGVNVALPAKPHIGVYIVSVAGHIELVNGQRIEPDGDLLGGGWGCFHLGIGSHLADFGKSGACRKY